MNKPPNQTNQSFSLSVCISIDHSQSDKEWARRQTCNCQQLNEATAGLSETKRAGGGNQNMLQNQTKPFCSHVHLFSKQTSWFVHKKDIVCGMVAAGASTFWIIVECFDDVETKCAAKWLYMSESVLLAL